MADQAKLQLNPLQRGKKYWKVAYLGTRFAYAHRDPPSTLYTYARNIFFSGDSSWTFRAASHSVAHSSALRFPRGSKKNQNSVAFANHTAPIVMATKDETIDSLRGMSGWSKALPTRTLPSPIMVVVADIAA